VSFQQSKVGQAWIRLEQRTCQKGRHQEKLCGIVKLKLPNHTLLSFFFVLIISVLLLAASFFEVFLARARKKHLGARIEQ
jgi:hypothetical protein